MQLLLPKLEHPNSVRIFVFEVKKKQLYRSKYYSVGIFNMRAPKGVTFITQILWGSIGYSVGAALGAALAVKKDNRPVFLLVGDGSFQV